MIHHPIAGIIPEMSADDYARHLASIKKQGVLSPIWLYEGKILDGRQRYRACRELGIECPTADYKGNDPIRFVVAQNLGLRQLTNGQLAMAALAAANLRNGTNQHSVTTVNRGTAAAIFGIHQTSVTRAAKVMRLGIPALQDAVLAGELTLRRAEAIAGMPKNEQELQLACAKDPERHWKKGTSGARIHKDAAYTPISERQQALAKNERQRLESGIDTVEGVLLGIEQADFPMVASACDGSELRELADRYKMAVRRLRATAEGLTRGEQTNAATTH